MQSFCLGFTNVPFCESTLPQTMWHAGCCSLLSCVLGLLGGPTRRPQQFFYPSVDNLFESRPHDCI